VSVPSGLGRDRWTEPGLGREGVVVPSGARQTHKHVSCSLKYQAY
jgi:hypothetical protein